MPSAAVATATSPLWFATRATGLIALVLLTGTVVLGIVTSVRFASPAWPRFVTVSLHRNLSLLTITFTGLHVLTTITDPFASISVVSVVVPFTSGYRRIWLGFGAVAFDLLLAVLVTSLLRTRIGPRCVARGALGRLRLLAGRPGARARHRHRRRGPLGARDHRRLRPCGRLGGGMAAGRRLARARGAAGGRRRRGRGRRARHGGLGLGGAARSRLGAPGRHAGRAARALVGERRHRQRRFGWRGQRGSGAAAFVRDPLFSPLFLSRRSSRGRSRSRRGRPAGTAPSPSRWRTGARCG